MNKKINLNRQKFSLSNLRKLSESALKKALEEVGISEKPFPKSKLMQTYMNLSKKMSSSNSL